MRLPDFSAFSSTFQLWNSIGAIGRFMKRQLLRLIERGATVGMEGNLRPTDSRPSKKNCILRVMRRNTFQIIGSVKKVMIVPYCHQ
jgi:hypothetical protein